MHSHDVGFRLKKIREKLGLTQEAIQRASLRIARMEGNPHFALRHSHLSVIENSASLPNVFKLFTLCALYRLDFHEVLRWYGLSNERLSKFQDQIEVPVTHRLSSETGLRSARYSVPLPDKFSHPFNANETTFLTRLARSWKEAPVGLVAQLDLKNHSYAFIGHRDFMMYPLLQPGSFVQLDVQRKKIASGGWTNEFDRPIYFLELRHRYVCSWCCVSEDRLHLLPHPLSPCRPETVGFPNEVDVVGQVVGVTMRMGPER